MRRRQLIFLLGGTLIAWPAAVRAQQKAMPVIGYLWTASAEAAGPNLVAFRRGLGEAGYVEGQNVVIEYRMADGSYERLPALAADLVNRKVDVIVAISAPAAVAAKAATGTIPVIFGSGDDPIAAGLVASLGHPGGNLTGVSSLFVELHPKRLELLIELVPRAKVIAFLLNPNNSQSDRLTSEMQQAARSKGIQLPILKAGTEGEIDAAFASLASLRADAVIIGSDPFFFSRSAQLVSLAAHHAAPAMYQFPEFVVAGGLIAYGPSLAVVNHQIGIYAGKILRGMKPADLPVQQPTKFDLVINMKTAKALGLTMPQSLLARADEVIE